MEVIEVLLSLIGSSHIIHRLLLETSGQLHAAHRLISLTQKYQTCH